MIKFMKEENSLICSNGAFLCCLEYFTSLLEWFCSLCALKGESSNLTIAKDKISTKIFNSNYISKNFLK